MNVKTSLLCQIILYDEAQTLNCRIIKKNILLSGTSK